MVADRSDARLQNSLLRHSMLAAVKARRGDPAASTVSDRCAGAVLALVRFNMVKLGGR